MSALFIGLGAFAYLCGWAIAARSIFGHLMAQGDGSIDAPLAGALFGAPFWPLVLVAYAVHIPVGAEKRAVEQARARECDAEIAELDRKLREAGIEP